MHNTAYNTNIYSALIQFIIRAHLYNIEHIIYIEYIIFRTITTLLC